MLTKANIVIQLKPYCRQLRITKAKQNRTWQLSRYDIANPFGETSNFSKTSSGRCGDDKNIKSSRLVAALRAGKMLAWINKNNTKFEFNETS